VEEKEEEFGQGAAAADEVESVTQGDENVLNEGQRASSSSPASSAGGAPEDFQVRRKRIRH